MTQRRWIAENWDETSAIIVGAQAEHLARVLRGQPGMKADVVAGGRVFHAEVAAVTLDGEKSEVRFNLASELVADPALPVTLVLAIYKFDRMEWAIEKATELGVAAIVPVVAQRTEKHLAQAAAKRVERWRRIAHEAAQQARRADVPFVSDPLLSPRASRQSPHPCASFLPSRSALPRFVTPLTKPSKPWMKKARRSKSPSDRKADGLPRKRRSSTRMAGVLHRSVRAFCALKPQPSLRSQSLRRLLE